MTQSRPRYLNLLKIHLPITGLVSFLHRISGILLFCFIPLTIWSIHYSLQSEIHFQTLQQFLHTLLGSSLLIIFILILMQHFFAGIRFLLMDLNWGMERDISRKTARLSLLLSVVSTLAIAIGVYL